MKDSFILYLEQKEIFEMLTDEEAGKLIKAIFKYEETGQIEQLDKSLKIAFIPIKSILDRNKEKYEKVIERNRVNGKKGGRPKNPMGYLGNEEKPKKADNDNENDNEYDKDNVTTNVVNKASDSCVDGLQKIIEFYNQNIGLITPYGIEILQSYLKDMDYEVIIYAMQKAVEANIKTIQYIKGTLNNWNKAGIKTLIQAQEENQKFKGKSNSKSAVEEWLNE